VPVYTAFGFAKVDLAKFETQLKSTSPDTDIRLVTV
jgi:hypothetical protein